jgi:hypothetical protein
MFNEIISNNFAQDWNLKLSIYRVAAIFPEHFQSLTVAFKKMLLLIILPKTI